VGLERDFTPIISQPLHLQNAAQRGSYYLVGSQDSQPPASQPRLPFQKPMHCNVKKKRKKMNKFIQILHRNAAAAAAAAKRILFFIPDYIGRRSRTPSNRRNRRHPVTWLNSRFHQAHISLQSLPDSINPNRGVLGSPTPMGEFKETPVTRFHRSNSQLPRDSRPNSPRWS